MHVILDDKLASVASLQATILHMDKQMEQSTAAVIAAVKEQSAKQAVAAEDRMLQSDAATLRSTMLEMQKEIAGLGQHNASLLAAVEELKAHEQKENTMRDESMTEQLPAHLKEINDAVPAMVAATLRSCFDEFALAETLHADGHSESESEMLAMKQRVDALAETVKDLVSANHKESMSKLIQIVSEHQRQAQLLDSERREQRRYAREMESARVGAALDKDTATMGVQSTLSCLNVILSEAIQDRERDRSATIECLLHKQGHYNEKRTPQETPRELKQEIQAVSEGLKNFDTQIQARLADLGADLSFLCRRLIGRTE